MFDSILNTLEKSERDIKNCEKNKYSDVNTQNNFGTKTLNK
jgi:hypothetical protein